MRVVKRPLEELQGDNLPIPRGDFIQFVSLCVRFGTFIFEGEEYVQHKSLAMGSPLSAVMACLYMETLEADSYFRILGKGSVWLRYIDDILAVVRSGTDIDNKLRLLNNVNRDIQFTIEREQKGKAKVIWRGENSVRFSVNRKPTNKDDFIH